MLLLREIEECSYCPGQMAQLVGVSSHTSEGLRFDFRSGYIPRFQVQSRSGPVRGQPINVSLSFSLSLKSTIKNHTSLGRIKKVATIAIHHLAASL